MPAELRSISHGHTMVLTLCNPGHRNALDPAMYGAGVEALNAAGDNPDIRSVVIVGEGNTFCSGTELRHAQAQRLPATPLPEDSIDGLHLWIEEIRTFPKPVVAAVEGVATGAGFSLALACDFIVAARDAVFSIPRTHAGLHLIGGASWHLSRSLPRQLVNEISMLGESLSAERLHAAGIVNRLSQTAGAMADALLLTERLNAVPPDILANAKELAGQAPEIDLVQYLRQERDHHLRNIPHRSAAIETCVARNI